MIVAEEKEAARASCAFACLKNHVTVKFWAQASFENLKAGQVFLESGCKGTHTIVSDLDVFIDNHSLVFIFFLTAS